ncbi:High-affinity branched-chain amino acid transport system permease protein LivH [Paraconexibacter sp. AEG42_29]|uniref:High-affinity branched-chain amino acid transport system permease protein LivH n=1 Tax=Paraconexibacter sp. AEG42_29 TaxID=2997339 RepID=A0AAU7AU60_9ACTN
MTEFIELTINGFSLGAIYALIAIGFVLVFKATGVVNFAHGSVLLLGAYVTARTQEDLGFWVALVVGAAVAGAGAALIDVLLMRRVRAVDAGTLAILTLGIDIVLATELTRRIGPDIFPSGAPWGSEVVRMGDYVIPETRVAAAGIAIVILTAFYTAFRFTDWGIAMRAAAADGRTAALMGVRLNRVAAGAWALAGAIAAVAGVFFTSFPAPGVDNATGLSALAAIPAAVIGGLDSLFGALVGGIMVGLVATYCAGYQDELSFLGRGLGEIAPYTVMLIVLLIRPAGLFGSRGVTRV